MVVKGRERRKHLAKERKHLFSKRAKESDFRRTDSPKYLNLKAAELPRLPSLHNSVHEGKTAVFSHAYHIQMVMMYLWTPTWQITGIK